MRPMRTMMSRNARTPTHAPIMATTSPSSSGEEMTGESERERECVCVCG